MWGMPAIRPAVWGWAGWLITSCTGPISATRPAYSTATRSQVSAITPMSWVISITAAPRAWQMLFSSVMICACIDTSSAVVGSSATINCGSPGRAPPTTPPPGRAPRAQGGGEKWGVGGEGQRNHHPLAHAAGELVRVMVDALRGCRDAGVLQQPDRTLAGLGGRYRQVGQNGFTQLAAHRVQRVQRGQRVLKDGADAAPANVAQLALAELVDALALQQDLARDDAARRLQQADDGRAGERLAGAGFPHHAQNLAGCDGKADVIERAQAAAPAGEFDHQVFDFQERHGLWCLLRVKPQCAQRRRGLSASRSQSPSRFTDSAISTSMAPGKTVTHHSPENRKLLPVRISVPSEGEVGGAPTPRKDSVASVMIAVATCIVASTSPGPMTLGSTCRRMMRSGATPATRAACTYSLLRSTSVEPRTVRAYCTQPVSEIDRISTPKASDSWACGNSTRPTPAISKATRMGGKDSITSHNRISTASIQPPRKPASRPRDTPSATDSSTETRPTTSEMRAPYISAERMSRPCSSVPSRYFVEPRSLQAGGSWPS